MADTKTSLVQRLRERLRQNGTLGKVEQRLKDSKIVNKIEDLAKMHPDAAAIALGQAAVQTGSRVGSFFPPELIGSADHDAVYASLIAYEKKIGSNQDSQRSGLADIADEIERTRVRNNLVETLRQLCGGSIETARKVQIALSTLTEHDFALYEASKSLYRG